jgi:hypothetical protein
MGDSVDHDIRILGERNWRNFALNREERRKLLKEGQSSCGAVEPMMMMTYQQQVVYKTFKQIKYAALM